MQSFAINSAPPAGPKNYVFVDEHNRHKRLKVMRACEGCRRRKIRCDSATTNTWPCAACVRLKLHCVPPVGGVEGEFGAPTSMGTGHMNADIHNYNPSVTDGTSGTVVDHQSYSAAYPGHPFEGYPNYDSDYTKDHYYTGADPYQNLYPEQSLSDPSLGSFHGAPYRTARADSDGHNQVPTATSPIAQYTAEDLSQHLGDLRINENGIAPYIRQQKADDKEPEGPLQDTQEPEEFKFSTDAGSQIRIPPALMPEDDDALAYFEIFFREIHPYVPVLCKSQFYHQWHNKRDAISPLLLEAIFACAGRMSDDAAQGAQWLALANSESFFLFS
jgi:hypothetical protein